LSPLTLIIIIVWVLTVSVLIAIFVHNMQKKKQGKTFSKEFNHLALSVGLSKNDIKDIKDILVKSGISKPYLIFSDANLLEKVILENIASIEKLNLPPEDKEKRILALFEIKRKIFNHYHSMREGLRSTMEIEANQLLSMKVGSLGKFYTILILNDRKNLICSMPEIKEPFSLEWKDKPVEIYFWRYNDAGYVFKSTIENVVNNKRLQSLLIAHTTDIKRIQRREYPRRKARFNCKFFKFSITTSEQGKPVALLGKTHFGVVIDLSPGGASIMSDEVPKKNSNIKLDFSIGEESYIAYGTVMNVVRKKNMYIVHIQFHRMSDRVKNTIYRYVYNYI
jgi:c-di-GMP-binding flagellar brake protein YcgR